jgi:hypothetical protein
MIYGIMAGKYYYKGVDLNNLIMGFGGNVFSYSDTNNFTGLAPAPFGYKINFVDLSTKCFAKTNFILKPDDTFSIPLNLSSDSNYDRVDVILLGGGGGGGGGGGSGGGGYGNGGGGGGGAGGAFVFFKNISPSIINSCSLILGTGGTGGGGGGGSNGGNTGDGNIGNLGNDTKLIYNTTDICVAGGGGSGGGGGRGNGQGNGAAGTGGTIGGVAYNSTYVESYQYLANNVGSSGTVSVSASPASGGNGGSGYNWYTTPVYGYGGAGGAGGGDKAWGSRGGDGEQGYAIFVYKKN